ncbi:TetR/AcrR family transcriptional regulator [Microbispora sp. NPDC046933]|uniref:TetR/AcrR family transcriptional regulator n=1 Tax=Microbispora sp. NPDC046933 TaxID=3155618 RepID=UPI0033D18472
MSSSSTRRTAGDAAPGTRQTRRRGDALTQAVYRATLDELAEVGFEGLRFDKIASRAGTGKAALYRRWSTPAELVMAALTDPSAGFGGEMTVPATGALRTDLVALLGNLARTLDEPHGRALRPLLSQRSRHPELYAQIRTVILKPRQAFLRDLLRAAADRGEVRPAAVTDRIASVGPKMVVMEHMDAGVVTAADVEAIVDEVLMPLISATPPTG